MTRERGRRREGFCLDETNSSLLFLPALCASFSFLENSGHTLVVETFCREWTTMTSRMGRRWKRRKEESRVPGQLQVKEEIIHSLPHISLHCPRMRCEKRVRLLLVFSSLSLYRSDAYPYRWIRWDRLIFSRLSLSHLFLNHPLSLGESEGLAVFLTFPLCVNERGDKSNNSQMLSWNLVGISLSQDFPSLSFSSDPDDIWDEGSDRAPTALSHTQMHQGIWALMMGG